MGFPFFAVKTGHIMRNLPRKESMPRKSQLIQGALLAASVAYGIRTKIKARKAAELYLAAHEAFKVVQRVNEIQISYLCHMLDENEIAPDEFDLIALNFNHDA
jgi:hypothetical protein